VTKKVTGPRAQLLHGTMPIVFEDILSIFESLTPEQAATMLSALDRGMPLWKAQKEAAASPTVWANSRISTVHECPYNQEGTGPRCRFLATTNMNVIRQHYARIHCASFVPRIRDRGGVCAKCLTDFPNSTSYYTHSLKCFHPIPGSKEAIELAPFLIGAFAIPPAASE